MYLSFEKGIELTSFMKYVVLSIKKLFAGR
jgi:hypothetical protein